MHDADIIKHVTLQDLTYRTAPNTQCTEEEMHITDEYVSQCFTPDTPVTDPTSSNKPPRKKYVKESKTPLYNGGISEIYRDGDLTWAHVIYNDLDVEDVTLVDLIDKILFHKDPNKTVRRQILRERYLCQCHLSLNMNHTRTKTTNQTIKIKPHETTFWSWRRPQIFGGPTLLLPEDGDGWVAGKAGGPGLPSGTASGVG
jgi:hypothetical protein